MEQIIKNKEYTEVKTFIQESINHNFLSDEAKLKLTECYQKLSVNNAKEILKIVQDVYFNDITIYSNALDTKLIKMSGAPCLAGAYISTVSYFCKKSTEKTSNTHKFSKVGSCIGNVTIVIAACIFFSTQFEC